MDKINMIKDHLIQIEKYQAIKLKKDNILALFQLQQPMKLPIQNNKNFFLTLIKPTNQIIKTLII